MLDKTMIFSINGDRDQEIKNAMISVYNSLKQKGYNPINQLVGYILSEDPVSSHPGCPRLWNLQLPDRHHNSSSKVSDTSVLHTSQLNL